jgi:tripartite-type tricarboxylate transporter receptor subunit TctC
MVIGFAPGGGTDVLGRILAPRLAEVLGQQVVIENVGGAGGMVGSARVAKAAPDGISSCSAAEPMPSIRRSTRIRSTTL